MAGRLFNATFRTLLTAIETFLALRRIRPEIVVANSYGVTMFGWLYQLFFRKPLVTIHYHPVLQPGTRDFRLARFIYHRNTRIICVSQAIKQSLQAAGVPENKLQVIHNGLDLGYFDPEKVQTGFLRQRFGLPASEVLLALVGTIVPWKGHLLLVEAVNLLKREKSDLSGKRFLIIGDLLIGNQKEKAYKATLESKIQEYGLQDLFVFTGRHNNMRAVYKDIDILLNCSVEPEPLGTTIYEGMSMGKLAVASHLGGSPEIVDHGLNGVIFKQGDASSLKDAIKAALQMHRAGGYNPRQKVVSHFDVRKSVQNYEQAFAGMPGQKNLVKK